MIKLSSGLLSSDGFLRWKKMASALLWATVLLAIAGTSYRFDINVETTGLKPVFTFSKPLFAPPRWSRSDVELNSFQVVRKQGDTWDYKNPMWALELHPGAVSRLNKIEYGVAPPDFTETAQAKPLEQGELYLVLAFGLGSSGSKEFTLGN